MRKTVFIAGSMMLGSLMFTLGAWANVGFLDQVSSAPYNSDKRLDGKSEELKSVMSLEVPPADSAYLQDLTGSDLVLFVRTLRPEAKTDSSQLANYASRIGRILHQFHYYVSSFFAATADLILLVASMIFAVKQYHMRKLSLY